MKNKNSIFNIFKFTKSSNLFETIFETVTDGLIIIDNKSKILLANKAFEKMIGYTKQELYAKTCLELTLQSSTTKSKEILEIVRTRGYYGGYKKQYITKNNSIIDTKNELTLMEDKKTILVSIKDITLENKFKNEIEVQRQQLIQQSRFVQMGEMIAMIAHQWRQPLNTISVSTSKLLFKNMTKKLNSNIIEKELKYIDVIIQHLSNTINDFRNFFKSSKEKENTTIKHIIESTLNIIQASIENKGIMINVNITCDHLIHTYPSEIKQVLLNLLKNAEDALLDNQIETPIINIESHIVDKNRCSIVIKDNAGGVSSDIINQIFDPYFSTKKNKDGTGLGLYMSKIIIEEHCGGTLNINNDKNGAVFKIELANN